MIDRRVRTGGIIARPISHALIEGLGGVELVVLDGNIACDVELDDRLVAHISGDAVAMFFPELMGSSPRISVWVNGVRVGVMPPESAAKYGRKLHRLQEKVRRPIAVRAAVVIEGTAILRLRMPASSRM